MKIALKAVAPLSLLLALFLAGCQAPSGGGSSPRTNNLEALKTAANGGDADAALKLGDIFMNGRGVPKNAIEAKVWYDKAKELFDKK
jgi:TPR repeat protein